MDPAVPLAQDLIASLFTNAARHGEIQFDIGMGVGAAAGRAGHRGGRHLRSGADVAVPDPEPHPDGPTAGVAPASGVGVLVSAVVPGREVFEVVRTGTTTRAYVHDGGPDRFDLVVQIAEGPQPPHSTLPVGVLAEGRPSTPSGRHGARTSCSVPSGRAWREQPITRSTPHTGANATEVTLRIVASGLHGCCSVDRTSA